MKQTITKLLGGILCALFLAPSSAGAQRTFQNFKIDFSQGGDGQYLTTDEYNNVTAITAGVKVTGGLDDSYGTVERVASDDANSIATISGTTKDMHGFQSFSMTIDVDGPVRIIVGTCRYSGSGTVSVLNSSSVSVVSGLNTAGEQCFHENRTSNMNSAVYVGGATTLTISGGGYMPYIAMEKVTNLIEVSYSKGEVVCEGTLVPTGGTYVQGDSYTIPYNKSLYKNSTSTLAWTDGVNVYKQGQVITLPSSATLGLTAVFIDNPTTLNDRASATTVTWDFQTKNGAPTYDYTGGNHEVPFISQAIINGVVIDQLLNLNTGSSGKIDNASWTDWAQLNEGTILTIPAAQNMTINVTSMSNQTTSFGGDTDYEGYNTSNNVTYTYTGTNSTIDIVIGAGSYFRTVTATYPAQSTRTVTIGSAKYGTYYSNIAYTLPENLQAATVDGNTGGTLSLNYRYNAGEKVPGGTAVLLKASAAGDYTLTMDAEDATSAPAGNLLHGSDVATTTTGGDKYYALQYGTGSNASVLGFYWVNASGTAFTSPAHKAWLALPDGGANFFSLDDNTTGINMVNGSEFKVNGEYYNLAGQHVAQPTRGLYIVNGKKVIIK